MELTVKQKNILESLVPRVVAHLFSGKSFDDSLQLAFQEDVELALSLIKDANGDRKITGAFCEHMHRKFNRDSI